MFEHPAGTLTDETVTNEPYRLNPQHERTPSLQAEPTRFIGSSDVLRNALRDLSAIVESSAPVLILGESGTGKELLARKIHALSARAGAFVAQNAAAMPAELVESEIFGHAQGAFSGATHAKQGLLELADRGTFLLDEIGDLSPALQAKLLRVIEDKEVRRVGETHTRKLDFRLVCATNRDIQSEVQDGRFRRDLFYRINVFTVTLPPLRERLADVPELADHFAALAAQRLRRPQPGISPKALDCLRRHDWPGNIRELANVIERAVALTRDAVLDVESLRLEASEPEPRPRVGKLREVLDQVERELVTEALAKHGGNVTAAACGLGLARQQLQRVVHKHGLQARARA